MKGLRKLSAHPNYLRRLGGFILDVASALDYFTAGQKDCLKFSTSNAISSTPKVAVYVSYKSLQGDKYESVLFEALQRSGFSIIKVINDLESKEVESPPDQIFRKNNGRDLGAIRDILLHLDTNVVEELFIFNSSLAFLSNIEEFLVSIRKEKADQVTVGVQSYQKMMHFQSFFYYASGNGIATLKNSFEVVRNVRYKRTLINFGEIWISRRLIKSGIQLNILYPYPKVLNRKPKWYYRLGIALNPSLDCAEDLIVLGAPFVKRSHPKIRTILDKDWRQVD